MDALDEGRATLRPVVDEEAGADGAGDGSLEQPEPDTAFRSSPEHDLRTNWLHRGDREPLASMGVYHYAMYVYTAQGSPLLFDKEDFVTYAFADTHPAAACRVQKLRVGAPFKVPRLWGFTMPAREKDVEVNALFKTVLFRPLQPGPRGTSRWAPFRGAVDAGGAYASAWQTWWEGQLRLSRDYDACEERAGKWFTIEDINVDRGPDDRPGLFDSRPSAAEFMAHWTVQVVTNMDVEAEARGRPRVKVRPDGRDFVPMEQLAAENRPAEDAEEEAGAGGGAGLDGFVREAEDAEVDDAWAAYRQEPAFLVPQDQVPVVAACDGVRGAALAQPYKKAFLEGYARDHKPSPAPAPPDRGYEFLGRDFGADEFEAGQARQAEMFRYRRPEAGSRLEESGGDGGVPGAAGVSLASGRGLGPAVAGVVAAPPRAREVADALMREWADRRENPVVFSEEQKAVIALVVGQVEATVSFRQAVERGEDPEPVEQMVLLLHGQGGTGKTEVVSLLGSLLQHRVDRHERKRSRAPRA